MVDQPEVEGMAALISEPIASAPDQEVVRAVKAASVGGVADVIAGLCAVAQEQAMGEFGASFVGGEKDGLFWRNVCIGGGEGRGPVAIAAFAGNGNFGQQERVVGVRR